MDHLEISFHRADPSPTLKADIERQAAELQRRFPRIYSLRVSIEGTKAPANGSDLVLAHVQVRVPGQEFASTNEPQKAQRNQLTADIRGTLRNAFAAVERQLERHKDKQRGDVKPHPAQVYGQIAELHPEQDYGYLLTNTGGLLYFHRSSLIDSPFDALQRGDKVQYVEADGDTGPTASKVWRSAGGNGGSNGHGTLPM
jgi:cold shock CspA family protein/ribosome-associated translation inhibitor RaiA